MGTARPLLSSICRVLAALLLLPAVALASNADATKAPVKVQGGRYVDPNGIGRSLVIKNRRITKLRALVEVDCVGTRGGLPDRGRFLGMLKATSSWKIRRDGRFAGKLTLKDSGFAVPGYTGGPWRITGRAHGGTVRGKVNISLRFSAGLNQRTCAVRFRFKAKRES